MDRGTDDFYPASPQVATRPALELVPAPEPDAKPDAKPDAPGGQLLRNHIIEILSRPMPESLRTAIDTVEHARREERHTVFRRKIEHSWREELRQVRDMALYGESLWHCPIGQIDDCSRHRVGEGMLGDPRYSPIAESFRAAIRGHETSNEIAVRFTIAADALADLDASE